MNHFLGNPGGAVEAEATRGAGLLAATAMALVPENLLSGSSREMSTVRTCKLRIPSEAIELTTRFMLSKEVEPWQQVSNTESSSLTKLRSDFVDMLPVSTIT